MNIFEGDEIFAIGYDEKEIRIAYKNAKDLQEYLGVHTINVGGMLMAGPRKECVQIETIDGKKF